MSLNRRRWVNATILMLAMAAGSGQVAAQSATPTSPVKKAATSTTKPGAKPATKSKKPVAKTTASRTRGQTAPTRDRIIEIQQALAREGFYSVTPPSGKWDPETSQAMSNFQTAKGLTPTGKLGALSLQKLGLGSEIAGKAAPIPQADTRPSVLSESDLNEPEPETKEQ